MRLSEIHGEAALDVLADLIEPAAEILADKAIADVLRTGKPVVKAVRIALKEHKRAVLDMLAAIDGEDPETYAPSALSIPIKLLNLLNDPELQKLFQSAGQTSEGISSVPQSANTEVSAQ